MLVLLHFSLFFNLAFLCSEGKGQYFPEAKVQDYCQQLNSGIRIS